MTENEAATRLMQNRQKIVKHWEQRALKEVNSAHRSTSLVLRDNLEFFLEQLSEALAEGPGKSPEQLAREAGDRKLNIDRHGSERAGQIGYVLSEVIFEFHILRQVVFEVLEEFRPLTKRERDTIIDSIEQAVNDAASAFSNALSEIREQFSVALAHDLRGPLTAAKVAAQVILRRPGRVERDEKMAFHIIENMDRLDSMIRDILNASKLQAGEKLQFEMIPFELDSLVHEVVTEYRIQDPNRFFVSTPHGVSGQWNPEGLRRVLQNLITNALKFGAPGTPITVKLEASNRNIRIIVHNLGHAIPEEKQSKLFEPFQQLKSSTNRPGWGLGLFLVRGIVEAHGGKVSVESSEKSGTSFIVELPRERPHFVVHAQSY